MSINKSKKNGKKWKPHKKVLFYKKENKIETKSIQGEKNC